MDCHGEELMGEMVSVSSHMTVFDKERIHRPPFNQSLRQYGMSIKSSYSEESKELVKQCTTFETNQIDQV